MVHAASMHERGERTIADLLCAVRIARPARTLLPKVDRDFFRRGKNHCAAISSTSANQFRLSVHHFSMVNPLPAASAASVSWSCL